MTERFRKPCRPAAYALRLIVVLVFGFKALIPAGYMYAEVNGHARLVMCPAGLAGSASRHHMSGMAHGAAMNHAGHAALPADQCPFALAGAAGLLASNHTPPVPYFTVLEPARARAFLVVPASPPSRYHAPRGPPSAA